MGSCNTKAQSQGSWQEMKWDGFKDTGADNSIHSREQTRMHETIDGNKQTCEADMDKPWSADWSAAAGKVDFYATHLFVHLISHSPW